uniref:Uncharacterized protein n=1 Tax=Anguilla anguilla TaxID=7936 RepID=A0A0E9V6W2_ANGAN
MVYSYRIFRNCHVPIVLVKYLLNIYPAFINNLNLFH